MKSLTLELSDTDHAAIVRLAQLFKTTPEKFAKFSLLTGLNGWDATNTDFIEMWVEYAGRASIDRALVAGFEECLQGRAPKDACDIDEKGRVTFFEAGSTLVMIETATA